MTAVADHYANHLAPVYSWMVGDFDEACNQAAAFYRQVGLPTGSGHLAVDLGCGHGVHAVSLAELGYRVLAIDSSAQLLSELQARVGIQPIRVVTDDLTRFADRVDADSARLIVCMGDTLPHLQSIADVAGVLRDSARCLHSDGTLLLSFRDYVNHELTGDERFIPVRSDASRIHTCFLEYAARVVHVHDIICELRETGWETAVSSYPKLRLSPDYIVTIAESHGLAQTHHSICRGMVHMAFVTRRVS